MSMSPFFRERIEIRQQLQDAQEWSLLNVYQTDLPKILVVATASRFEREITQHIEDFYREATTYDSATLFVINKALSRQYHTLFAWNENTATSFMKLFGAECASNFKSQLDAHDWLATSVKDFLTLGRIRNELVHRDFASFPLDLTVEEVDVRSQSAERFVAAIPQVIRVDSISTSDVVDEGV
ncbi:HEPN domain-containing protein [Arthrobacter sp. M2012083]|uniref:HEPN domain-containing protein n=1 Tax=Arthrobacter sp. M2012083 TaxID=1197706 RepID=UPI00031C5FED|nr:HEPN domain-containing protein [Arthrobacter sp. M2012083]